MVRLIMARPGPSAIARLNPVVACAVAYVEPLGSDKLGHRAHRRLHGVFDGAFFACLTKLLSPRQSRRSWLMPPFSSIWWTLAAPSEGNLLLPALSAASTVCCSDLVVAAIAFASALFSRGSFFIRRPSTGIWVVGPWSPSGGAAAAFGAGKGAISKNAILRTSPPVS